MSNPTMTNKTTPDDWLDEIIQGVYRWTIDTVNDSLVPQGMQKILGTGSAPLLAPSEAVAAIMAWHNKEQIKLLERVERHFEAEGEATHAYIRDFLTELKGKP